MKFLDKVSASSGRVAVGSLLVLITASVCDQEDVASVAASVFWGSIATGVGSWAASMVQDIVSPEEKEV